MSKNTPNLRRYRKPLYFKLNEGNFKQRVFNGREYIMEEAIRGDFSLIKAWKADTKGNLIMRKASNNFNNDMAGASKITVAEVNLIVK